MFRSARDTVAGIPFGQPILVGHHSERRHRNTLEKHDRRMRAAVEADKRAAELARRAAAIGTGGISSDDPEAVAKLREKLTKLEAKRDRMKAVNAAYRKRDAATLEQLTGRTLEAWETMIAGNWSWDKRPFASYSLTNLGARIRDAKKRIAELELVPAHQEAPASEAVQIGEVSIKADPEELRVLLRSPRRFSKPAYQHVRSAGFVWSPTRRAFVRKYNPATLAGVLAAATRAAELIRNMEGPAYVG